MGNQFANQNTTQPEEAKRPAIITLACVLGFIMIVYFIQLSFSNIVEDGGWYPNYLGLSTLLSLVCMVGIWQMKKWAVFAYTALTIINQVTLFLLLGIGPWNTTELIIPALVIAVALAHVKKMSGPETSWITGSLVGMVPMIAIYFVMVRPGVETDQKRVTELAARLEALEEPESGSSTGMLAASISLLEAARQVNEACPLMVDADTRLDGAEVLPDHVFRYNYTLVNLAKAEMDTANFIHQLEPDITNGIRTSPEAQLFRNHKATVVYRYHDKNNVYAFTITITPEMYSLLNMPVQNNY